MKLHAETFRRWLGPVLLALLVVVAGCQAVARFAPGTLPARVEPVASPARVPGDTPVQASGVLELIVKWPTRDLRGFRAALIPTSTDALGITVTTGGGAIVLQQVVARPTGEATTSVKIELDTASDLGVKVEAFRESTPDLATAVPIARGTAAGVSILPSAVSTVPISLTALFVPTISGFSVSVGREGDAITISGDNLGIVDGATPSVMLEGTTASVSATVVPLTATSLRFTVPANAAVGRVVVTNDGVPSESSAIFWVPGGLSIDAPKAAWDPSPAGNRIVLFGKTLQFTATPTWVLRAGKTASSYGTAPVVAWTSSNSAAGTLSAAGLFSPSTTRSSSRIAGSLGSLESTEIEVRTEDLAVTLAPSTGEVGPAAYPATASFQAENVLTDGSTFSGVTFTVSESASLSVDGAGVVSAKDLNGYGRLVLTATSQAHTSRSATASVTLFNWKVTTLAGSSDDGFADGPGVSAMFNWPKAIAVNGSGTIYLGDGGNFRIRAISAAGEVSTFAGGGSAGCTGGTSINTPTSQFLYGVGADTSGNVYFSDTGCARILKVDSNRNLTTFKTLSDPEHLVVDGSGNVIVTDDTRIRKITPDGTMTTLAGSGASGGANGPVLEAEFANIAGLALTPEGTLYIADMNYDRIRRIADGQVSTWAGDGTAGYADGPASSARFNDPRGVAVDTQGNVYVADTGNNRIRRISAGGTVSTVAGGGSSQSYANGFGTYARFAWPNDLALGPQGQLYVADTNNSVVRKIERLP